MLFSEQLRHEGNPIFEAIFQHPFVQGIATGELHKEQLIHYVKQDYEYLNTFMRVYGLAISKSSSRKDIELFNSQITFVLNSESHPHHNFCRMADVSYEELQGFPMAPTAHHYTHHLMTVAHEGTLAEIISALLPCPWTYMDIGQRLLHEVSPKPDHPFYEWITFYGQTGHINDQFCKRLDALAQTATKEERQRMLDHFLISCQLEYKFWDMAYTLEEWPVSQEVPHP
ncbi:thiaminase/transcriptional activator TenA [Pullulanibacillus pueri]|uniref:Aminopyrimidine aminohydrolase n=1 Tax=Pullulanibacillus pueri TaxID=1437324 RepID=A0A8J2ZZF1_9BACL|nr:thiaminase II [Pullulanibacillus pueri]MBM7683452.1 thiaminase/transcriptional activator TenA [Pullulanibacillus pueri]GGH87447.1 aminopyrimidine aminohydrolase [Pullulanibacillus pueri]